MAFNTPAIKDIIDRMDTDAEGRLPGAQPRLRRSLLGAVIRAAAGGIYGLYGVINKLIDYIMPDTSTGFILDRWSAIFLRVGRKAAAAATGSIIFTGNNGVVITAGTTVQRADGVEFTTTAPATIVDGTASAAIAAAVADANSNTVAGVTLTLTIPIAGINSATLVDAGGVTGGFDIESDDSLRSRLLSVLRNPPQSGNANDYIVWAREVSGVTRAWSYPLEGGTGNVAVRFMMDDSYADGIPQVGDVTNVEDYITPLMPAGAVLSVVSPVATPLDFTIAVTPNTDAVKAAVIAELTDMILRDSQPGGTILLSRINEAISLANGETDHTVTSPSGNVSHTINQITTMGAVTWN